VGSVDLVGATILVGALVRVGAVILTGCGAECRGIVLTGVRTVCLTRFAGRRELWRPPW
jgi:hypothetical protein